jgi:transposase
MRWRDAFLAGGKEALEPKPVPGRPNRLTEEQRALLIQYLLQGSLAHGYQTDLWTTQRIADLIKKKFKIQYHPDHIGRLLHAQGWSCQKPERRALQRKEARIQGWRRRTWPTVKKTPNGWAPISPLPTNPASS